MNEVRKGRSHFVVPKVHGGRLAGVLSRSHDVSFQLKKSLLLLPILCLSATTNCGHVGLNYVDDDVLVSSGGLGGDTNGDGDGDSDTASGGTSGSDGSGGKPGAGGDGSGGKDGSGGDAGGTGGETSGGGGAGGGAGGMDASGGSDSGGGGGSGSSGGSGGSGGASSDCKGGTEADFSIVGWATESGGTTGGKGGTTVTVYSGAQLINALQNKQPQVPLTILVNGTITPANTGAEKIDIKDVRDVSIIGLDDQGEFDGIGLKLWRTSNVVLRNLRIHHVNIGEQDGISIAGPADHIWVDHCDLYNDYQGVLKDDYDGLIDAKDDSEYITYSWNKLHDSWKVHLIGSSETDTRDRKLTMHHNWIENVDGDVPAYRGGVGHVFNNYMKDVTSLGINSREGACLRVENNVFVHVHNPWVSAYSTTKGGVELICNDLDDASTFEYSDDVSDVLDCALSVPYDYADQLTATSSVTELVQTHAGVGKLTDPQDF